jgi:enamine deaminase RidA (YjgF/YER057c/UK114 family)
MPDIKILNPDSLGKPLGQYSQLTRVKPWELLFIAGQVGADKDGKTPADFDGQCAQVFANIGAALASQGAGFANLVEFTTYLVHSQDIPAFMAYRTREFPKLFAGGAYCTRCRFAISDGEIILRPSPTTNQRNSTRQCALAYSKDRNIKRTYIADAITARFW